MKVTKQHTRCSSSFDPYSVQRFLANSGGSAHRQGGSPDSDASSTVSQGYIGSNLIIGPPRSAQLFATNVHVFKKGKYATTGGDRGFMAVYEYDVRGNTMMIDVDTSFVRFTSITQALGRSKVNFGRLTRSCPELEPHIHKLKGGYLSIQGTWLPYDLAKELSRRVAWEIRDHLVPLFGYDFPQSCLRPEDEGYGQLAIGMSQKRARKRHNNGGPHQTSCYGPAAPLRLVGGHLIEQATCSPDYTAEPFVPTAPVMLPSQHPWDWNAPSPSNFASPGVPYHQTPLSQNNLSNGGTSAPTHASATLTPSMCSYFSFDGQTHHI